MPCARTAFRGGRASFGGCAPAMVIWINPMSLPDAVVLAFATYCRGPGAGAGRAADAVAAGGAEPVCGAMQGASFADPAAGQW